LAEVGAEDVPAMAAQHLLAAVADYLLGGLVEGGDAPAGVDSEDALGQALEDGVEAQAGGGRAARLSSSSAPSRRGEKSSSRKLRMKPIIRLPGP